MRIALISRRLDRIGGVERHVLNVAWGLQRRGHEVTLYTLSYDKEKLFPGLRDFAPVVVAPTYRELAERIDPATEVLNPHDRAYEITRHYKKIRNTPSVWTMHDMPTRLFSSERLAACRGTKVGLLRRYADSMRDAWTVMPHVRAQDAIAVLDERDARWVKESFNHTATVIRNGVAVEEFIYRKRSSMGKPLKLVMTGIFFPHRRFEDGIEALRLLLAQGVDATLDIIGTYNPQDSYFKSLPKLPQVNFRGKVSDAELQAAYRDADIFLFPNHLQSWGLAVFESLASGTPAVVSYTAGAAEVLTDRESALLVEPLRPERIAEAILELLRDPVLYTRLSAKGREVAENLTWDKTVVSMEALFERVTTHGT